MTSFGWDRFRQALKETMCAHSQNKRQPGSTWAQSPDRTWDEGLGSRLLPPQWNEHGDVPQPLVPEPVHSQLDALARKHLLVAMATKTQKQRQKKKNRKTKTLPLLCCLCSLYAHTPLLCFSGSGTRLAEQNCGSKENMIELTVHIHDFFNYWILKSKNGKERCAWRHK